MLPLVFGRLLERAVHYPSVSGTLARIVENEPPAVSAVRPQSLPELDRIVSTCLRKKSQDRYESTQDLVAGFEQLEAEVAQIRHHISNRSGHVPRRLFAAHELDIRMLALPRPGCGDALDFKIATPHLADTVRPWPRPPSLFVIRYSSFRS